MVEKDAESGGGGDDDSAADDAAIRWESSQADAIVRRVVQSGAKVVVSQRLIPPSLRRRLDAANVRCVQRLSIRHFAAVRAATRAVALSSWDAVPRAEDVGACESMRAVELDGVDKELLLVDGGEHAPVCSLVACCSRQRDKEPLEAAITSALRALVSLMQSPVALVGGGAAYADLAGWLRSAAEVAASAARDQLSAGPMLPSAVASSVGAIWSCAVALADALDEAAGESSRCPWDPSPPRAPGVGAAIRRAQSDPVNAGTIMGYDASLARCAPFATAPAAGAATARAQDCDCISLACDMLAHAGLDRLQSSATAAPNRVPHVLTRVRELEPADSLASGVCRAIDSVCAVLRVSAWLEVK